MPGRDLFAAETAPATTGRNLFAADAQDPSTPVGMPTLAGLRSAATAIPDVALSMARGMVNKPSASLVGAANFVGSALLGRTNPADAYMQGQQAARASINRGEGIVQPEGLRTPEGARLAQGISQGMSYTGLPLAANKVGQGLEAVGGPALRDFGSSVGELASLGLPGLRGAPEIRAGVNADRSMGAAASASPTIAAEASAPLKEAVGRLMKNGSEINNDVLARKVEADSLPVKISLTEGQATRDPVTLSNERNMRANQPEFAKHFNEQEQQIVENLSAIRDQAGPTVFSANQVEHGDALIRAYRDKAAVADRDIAAKYKALKDANGGEFPVDARALLQNASESLHQQLLYDHAPPEVMKTLNRLATSNKMTFENFESLRTNLARIQRSQADGNVKAAAGVIRGAMEELPLERVLGRFAATAKLKPLADEARAAARTQFQALDADPAYKAAVTDSVPPDRFVQKYLINAPRDDVARMRANLARNETALQTMGVSAIDHLRQNSGIDVLGNGRFSQARFNKLMESLSPKLRELVGPQAEASLQKLGNVARYIQEQPAGSFVNNSNTMVAQAGNAAMKTGEGVVNFMFGGVPVGTFGKHIAEKTMAGKRAKNALAPEAGLNYRNSLPETRQ